MIGAARDGWRRARVRTGRRGDAGGDFAFLGLDGVDGEDAFVTSADAGSDEH